MRGEEDEADKQPEAEALQSFTFVGLNINNNKSSKLSNVNSKSIKKATKSKNVNGNKNNKSDKSGSVYTNDYWDVSTGNAVWSSSKMSGKERRALQLATFQESLQLNFEASLDMNSFQ